MISDKYFTWRFFFLANFTNIARSDKIPATCPKLPCMQTTLSPNLRKFHVTKIPGSSVQHGKRKVLSSELTCRSSFQNEMIIFDQILYTWSDWWIVWTMGLYFVIYGLPCLMSWSWNPIRVISFWIDERCCHPWPQHSSTIFCDQWKLY